MLITSRHFFRNLWGFISGKPTVFTFSSPSSAWCMPAAFRGMPVLVQMDNGKERCVACGLCEWACPTDCITIFPAETDDGIERYPRVFDIDMSRCMFCGLCEEACPEEAIVMSPKSRSPAFARPMLCTRATCWCRSSSCGSDSSTCGGGTIELSR